MSGQRSDWRERLHANPSRMEPELAIRLQDDQIRYLTQVEIPVPGQFCVARPARIPYFSRCSIASRIFTGTHQESCSRLSKVKPILSSTCTLRRFLGVFLGTLRLSSVSSIGGLISLRHGDGLQHAEASRQGRNPDWQGLSEIVRDLLRQMLRMHFDDSTIVFHLKSTKTRNAQKILDSVLAAAKQDAIAQLSSRNR